MQFVSISVFQLLSLFFLVSTADLCLGTPGSDLDPELAVLTEVFPGFLQYLYANVDTAPENKLWLLLPFTSLLVFHYSTNHSMLHNVGLENSINQ
jgi:hypothetical protein